MSTGWTASRQPDAPDRAFHLSWWANQRREFPGFELVPHVYRLVAEGEPVTPDRVAAAAGQPLEEVEAKLRRHRAVEWGEEGRLVGFGLSLRPTPHRFTFDGRTVYAWCASDALQFPIVLGRSGVIESSAPGSGQQIRVEVTPEHVVGVDPATAVVSMVRPERIGDVRGEVCAAGNFWPSPEAAAEWLAAYPAGMLLSIEEDFDLLRENLRTSGWAAPLPAPR